jgi:hypothetical protein
VNLRLLGDLIWPVFLITEVARISGYFFAGKVMYYNEKKMFWATFLAVF